MSDKFKMKWRMLKRVLRSKDCILISYEEDCDDFGFRYCGNSYMLSELFTKLKNYVPDWYRKWQKELAKKAEKSEMKEVDE